MQQQTKQDLRERILTLLRNQEEEERYRKSLAICDKLFLMPEIRQSSSILFYAPFDGEVDTTEMIKRAQQLGIMTALPKIISEEKNIVPTLINNLKEDLQEGAYGIPEPKDTAGKAVDPQDLSMVVVPGVAFDRQNHRLGRGGGYYDRFLKKLAPDTPTVGLAFDFQIVDHIPQRENHDVPVSCVVTN